jgi:hypothetical protein
MQHFQLTDDQEAAALAFAMFMASDDTEFTISGSAGVGKTTLLKHLRDMKDHIKIAQLLDRPVIRDWVFTATTNKAAEVLGRTLGEDAQTIHSFLGLQVYNDYATGSTKITRKRNSEVQENKVVVIDECSMIDKQLYRYIHECTHNCKIVYVGDHCQMAPVMEELSPVFDRVQPQFINQIVRSQHTPAITALCQQLRQTVETGVFQEIQPVPGVIDFLDPQQAETEIYDHFIADEGLDSRILCYTNKTVIGMNAWIRNARNLPPLFTPGEFVISNQATHCKGSSMMTRVEQELEIFSVSDVYDDTVTVDNAIHTIKAYDVGTNIGTLQIAVEPHVVEGFIKHFKKHQSWSQYFALKERYADLRPREACTVYKAQGSTYRTVFVHLKDIGSCTNAAQAARMLYVACSRPTHRICFIGQLPARFRGE